MSPKKKLEAAIDSLFSSPKLQNKKSVPAPVRETAELAAPAHESAAVMVEEAPVVEAKPAAKEEVLTKAPTPVAATPVSPEPAVQPAVSAKPSAAAAAPSAPTTPVTGAAAAPAPTAAPAPAAATANSVATAPTAATAAMGSVTVNDQIKAAKEQKPASAAEKLTAPGKAAAQADDEDCRGDFQSVVFLLDHQYYGLSIAAVESIIKLQSITELPHARNSIIGVTNLRGKVMPVVDLRGRFGLPTQAETKDTRIIVVNYNQIEAGLLVDGVSEVLTVDKCLIEPAPPMIMGSGVSSTFISGIAKVEDRLIILLDLEKVLYIEK